MTPQHPEAAALMATIRANKSDDLPRLVYADWLEEHGQEVRAEFIRKQIGGTINVEGSFTEQTGTKFEDWEYSDPLQWETRFPMLKRGFAFAIAGSRGWFLKNAAAIFRENPVEVVTLTDVMPERTTEGEYRLWNQSLSFATLEKVAEFVNLVCVTYGEATVVADQWQYQAVLDPRTEGNYNYAAAHINQPSFFDRFHADPETRLGVAPRRGR